MHGTVLVLYFNYVSRIWWVEMQLPPPVAYLSRLQTMYINLKSHFIVFCCTMHVYSVFDETYIGWLIQTISHASCSLAHTHHSIVRFLVCFCNSCVQENLGFLVQICSLLLCAGHTFVLCSLVIGVSRRPLNRNIWPVQFDCICRPVLCEMQHTMGRVLVVSLCVGRMRLCSWCVCSYSMQ